MSINKPEMSMHLRIMHTLSQISNRLGKHLQVTYKKKRFKNTYRGIYFTHCYEIYLNNQYVDTVYGDNIFYSFSIETLIKKRLKIVCRLKRKKNLRRYVRF